MTIDSPESVVISIRTVASTADLALGLIARILICIFVLFPLWFRSVVAPCKPLQRGSFDQTPSADVSSRKFFECDQVLDSPDTQAKHRRRLSL
jgi:hypothetical protein